MRWHLRNLICVIHNRTIGGHVTLDRYLAWHVSTIVCLRSLISLELHYATRPAEKSTYTVYVVSEFEVLFRHVPWSQTPGYVSSTLKMLRGWLTHYFRCHSAVVFHVVRDCMCFFCMCFFFFCMCFWCFLSEPVQRLSLSTRFQHLLFSSPESSSFAVKCQQVSCNLVFVNNKPEGHIWIITQGSLDACQFLVVIAWILSKGLIDLAAFVSISGIWLLTLTE